MLSRAMLATGLAAVLSHAPAAAVAEPGAFENGVLQPLADGFPSRPITLVNTDDPGSRDGIYARALQEELRGISPVDIVVSDEPQSLYGNFFVLRDIMSREGGPDGYYPMITTVPGVAINLMIEPITEELEMDLDDLNMAVVTETIPYVLLQRKDAPWGRTFADLVEHAKAHPGVLRYVSNQVGSGVDIAMEWIMDEVGVEVTKVPAVDNNAAAAAIGAGEGDFTLTQANVALTMFETGRVDVLLVTGSSVPEPWNEDPNVVSATAAGLPDAPWGIVLGFAVPQSTPPEHAEWLHTLFKAAAETEQHRARERTIPGAKIGVLGPEAANKLKTDIYAYAEPVVRRLGLHIDDQN